MLFWLTDPQKRKKGLGRPEEDTKRQGDGTGEGSRPTQGTGLSLADEAGQVVTIQRH